MNRNRKAQDLQPGDIIFGELIIGIMTADITPLGQNLLILTDTDTFRLLADQSI